MCVSVNRNKINVLRAGEDANFPNYGWGRAGIANFY